MKARRINMEMNLTLRCNMACPNCNRLCHLYPDRGNEEDMDLGQVRRFLRDVQGSPVKVKRLKLLGGEPLLHPDFPAVYDALYAGVKAGLIRNVKIETNGTIERPDVQPHPQIRWAGKRPSRKRHAPVLWSPRDLGHETAGPCRMPVVCGPSLDAYGYSLCSVCPGMLRAFGREDLYSDEFPGQWRKVFAETIDAMCPHCLWSMPPRYVELHSYPLDKRDGVHLLPTQTWKAALASWDGLPHKPRW